MFLLLLLALLIAAGIHIWLTTDRTVARASEIVLLWVLVGYCGIPMVPIAIGSLVRPDVAAAHLGFPEGNPFQTFLSVAYLGISLVAVLSLRYRGTYLVAPALLWSVFFTGATFIHMHDYAAHDALSHHAALAIFGTHGLIAAILAVALVLSGVWRVRGDN